jgi:hypothetical protein
MILKTRITNNRNVSRMCTWANMTMGPNETIVLEGAYPTACKSGMVSQMQADVDSGAVTVTIITDLNIERISNAVFPKTQTDTLGRVRPVIQQAGKAASDRETWMKEGSMETNSQPKVVFGESEIKTPPGPTVNMDDRKTAVRDLKMDPTPVIQGAPQPVVRPIKGQPVRRESAFSSSPVQQ